MFRAASTRKRVDRHVARETAQVALCHVVVANLIRRQMAEIVDASLYTVDEAIPEAHIIVQIARAIEVEKRADVTEAGDARGHARHHIVVVHEAKRARLEIGVEALLEFAIAHARLSERVETIDRFVVGRHAQARDRQRRERSTQAVAGEPQGLAAILKLHDGREHLAPHLFESTLKALMHAPEAAAAETSVAVREPIFEQLRLRTAEGYDDRLRVAGDVGLRVVAIEEAETIESPAGRGRLRDCTVGVREPRR